MDLSPVEQPAATDDPPRPRRSRRTWWLTGGAVLAVVLAVVIVVVVRASSGTAEPVFTHFPSAGCALITKATADTYAPGTTCQINDAVHDSTLIGANWIPPHVGNGPMKAVLSVTIVVLTGTLGVSDADRWLSNDCEESAGLPGARSINGIGDRACFVYVTQYGTAANLDVRDRNVVIEINYTPASHPPAPAISEQYGLQAAQTMVADVIRQLS